MSEYKVLHKIKAVSDIKKLNPIELARLSVELRDVIIDVCKANGGHLASNLGVVELIMAIHLVFDLPKDQLVLDVGHQSYAHKILTGRLDRIETLRKKSGLTGYMSPKESDCDPFGAGHASTSVSAAMGLKLAKDLKSEEGEVIALIGDGALTGGLAFEALNNLASLNKKVIVIINDNERSISGNVGALNDVLNNLRTSNKYRSIKKELRDKLNKLPIIGSGIKTILGTAKNLMKQALVEGMFFEELGLTYIGIIDGHDLNQLVSVLKMAKGVDGPIIIHVVTRKGEGYPPAVKEPGKYHGISAQPMFDENADDRDAPSFSKVFGNKLQKLAEQDNSVVAITAAMSLGTGLADFERQFKDRFYDVGIAEGHAVTFAAGLAKNGIKPYFAVYSTFLQRAYDMLIHDVCLQNLPVRIMMDRCGLVGEDGPTHHGVFDLPLLLSVPNLELLSPSTKEELEYCMDYSLNIDHPLAIRYPRANAPASASETGFKISNVNESADVVVFAFGSLYKEAEKAVNFLKEKGINAKVCKLLRLKPLDEEEIRTAVGDAKLLVSVEDSMISSGFGSKLRQLIDMPIPFLYLGYPDKFVEHGEIRELNEELGLDCAGIAGSIEEKLKDIDG